MPKVGKRFSGISSLVEFVIDRPNDNGMLFLSRAFFLIRVQQYRIVPVMNLNIFLDIQEVYDFQLKDNRKQGSLDGF